MSLEDKLYPFLAIYDRFPDGIKKAIGIPYRHLPESIRRGKEYARFKAVVEECESWDIAKVEQFKGLVAGLHKTGQRKRLQQVVHRIQFKRSNSMF